MRLVCVLERLYILNVLVLHGVCRLVTNAAGEVAATRLLETDVRLAGMKDSSRPDSSTFGYKLSNGTDDAAVPS
jgi:hypothetical protein